MAKRLLPLVLTLVVLSVLRLSVATADQPVPELVLGFQGESSIGEDLAIAAYLVDPAGNPIQGELVTFSVDAVFMNVLGKVEIGRATTDHTGMALLVHTPKLSGDRVITARFDGNEVFAKAEAAEPLLVAPGPETYVEETPFRIPGANVVTVVAVLVFIWTLYPAVMVLFILIARSGGDEGADGEARSWGRYSYR